MKTIFVAIQELIKNLRKDDLLHFIVCFALMLIFGLINPALGVGVSLTTAIGKEVYDYFHPDKHTYSRRDVFFDFAGIVLAFILVIILMEIRG